MEEEYLPWEKIKYQPLGDDFQKPEELWYILSLVRYGRKSPIQTED
nr:MAG TPA: hypothetical protein [Caudoviricetes sp.]